MRCTAPVPTTSCRPPSPITTHSARVELDCRELAQGRAVQTAIFLSTRNLFPITGSSRLDHRLLMQVQILRRTCRERILQVNLASWTGTTTELPQLIWGPTNTSP